MRTRLQARIQGYNNNDETTAASSDSEVSFNPIWLDRYLLGQDRERETEVEDDTDIDETSMADDRQERRLTLLESAVMGMNEKFDELLANFNTHSLPPTDRHRPAHSPHSSPVRGTGARAPGRHYPEAGRRHTEARPTTLNHRDPQLASFVNEQLQREEFVVPRHDEGKSLAADMYIQDLLPKPYMYMSKPRY